MNDYDLCHFGIKGMKWGIRRYQNEDGSYTDAGRKRYGIGKRIYKKIMSPIRADYKSKRVVNKVSDKTKQMVDDFKNLSETNFSKKYRMSKNEFQKKTFLNGDANLPAGKKLNIYRSNQLYRDTHPNYNKPIGKRINEAVRDPNVYIALGQAYIRDLSINAITSFGVGAAAHRGNKYAAIALQSLGQAAIVANDVGTVIAIKEYLER